jgi:hypothetical protein
MLDFSTPNYKFQTSKERRRREKKWNNKNIS